MWVLYSLLGLIALLMVVLSVPVFGRITYDGALSVRIRVLGIPVTLVPQPEKATPRRTRKAKTEPTQKPSKYQELISLLKQDSLAGTLSFLREVASLAAKTVGRVLRSLTVTRLDLQLIVATDDPAVTAQRYGQVCGVLYPALAGIESVVSVRQRNLRVEPNFLMEKSAVRFDICLRMSVWRLLGAGISLLWGFLMMKEQSNPQIKKEVS